MSKADHYIFTRHPELKAIFYLIRNEVQQAQRPADEVILDDEDVMGILKISKRKLQYLKATRTIPFHHFDAESPRTYYLLSDILEVLRKNRIESISNNVKIK